MLAPQLVSHRAMTHIKKIARARGKSVAVIVRDMVDLSEQIEAGNARVIIERIEAYNALGKKQGAAQP